MDIKVARVWLLLFLFGLGIVTTFLVSKFTFLSSEDSDDDDPEENATLQITSLAKEHWPNLEDLLETGYDVIRSYPTLEEATLILGDTGSGKTTLVQVLTGGVPLVAKDKTDGVGGNSLIPQLLRSNSSFFYNCPGLDSLGFGSDQNVATNFFLSQIVERVSHLKILFLLTHNSLKTTTGLDLLAEHVTNFIRNLPKYKNSIGLVVTSVKSRSREYYIKNEIVKLLSTFNQTLHLKLASDEEGNLIARKIEFIEGLLQKDQKGQYGKISFSRLEKERSQSELEKSQERLIITLQGNLEATPVQPGDFGHTVKSGNTTNSIQKVVERSNLEISESVEILLQHFQSWYDTTHFELKTEVEPFLQKIRVDYGQVASLTNPQLQANISDPLKFALSLKISLGKVGYRTPRQFLLFMERQQAYFHFFHEAGASPLRRDLEAWTGPIKKLKSSLANLRDWYDFIRQLQLVLHSYDFQIKKYVFPPRGEVLWLDYIESNMFPVSNRVRDVVQEIHAGELNMLNSVMVFALGPLGTECSGGTLTFTGNFIRLSELIDNNGNFRWSCNAGITKVEIYASHTIFIDSSLMMVGREMNIVMIAPAWDVISDIIEIELDLSGAPANNYPYRASDGYSSSSGRGGYGADGLSGKPGGPGGSLFGVTGVVRNGGKKLKIISTGGNGGNGQWGGQGGNGASGRDATKNNGDGEEIGGSGSPGGKGGNGGIGGLGGNGGQVRITTLVSGGEFLKIVGGAGNRGNYGLGGGGGRGGLNGKRRSCYTTGGNLSYRTVCKNLPPIGSADDGSRGVDNVGTGGWENSKPNKYLIVEWESIVNFKYTFFSVPHPQITSFRKLLEEMEVIEEYYTVKAYAEELIQLEEMSMRGDDADTEPLRSTYKSCINRMEAYLERKKENVTPSEKKVLALSLASAYSKLANMEQSRLGQDLGIIVDVSQYFSYLKEKLIQLRSASSSLTIFEENAAYGETIMVKVGQVQEFISGVVTPALNSAEDRFFVFSLNVNYTFQI